MKILVLGDIHGKTIWKDIVKKENTELVIFLGDYVSTHSNETADEQFHNLLSILRFKDSCPERVILLRGNHDIQHLGYHWANCSGWNPHVYKHMLTIKDEFLKKTQWLYVYNNILFSHAGVSKTWFKSTEVDSVEDINTLEPSELFGFTPDSIWDMVGESTTQPCTWIRPTSLSMDMLEKYIQVVGHTPAKEGCINLSEAIKKYGKKATGELWLCDALDNKSYLVIEDNNFIVKYL